MQDNTKGEIKQMRGSGPPILTVEGQAVGIEQIIYVLQMSAWNPSLPQTAQVIGIDLTRRTVRLQVIGGREILYCATGEDSGRNGSYWIFSSADAVKSNAARCCEQAVKLAEKTADDALTGLEKAKKKLADAKSWEPAQWDDQCDE